MAFVHNSILATDMSVHTHITEKLEEKVTVKVRPITRYRANMTVRAHI